MSDRWRRSSLVAAASLLFALHVSLSFWGVLNRSVTSDETAHLTAGYTYWKFGDYRFQPENGSLPQRWGALPLVLAKPRLEPADDPIEWRISSVWNVAQRLLFERGTNTDFLLLCSRCLMLVWSIAAGLLVFAWSRALWGPAAGLGSLALYCLSPTTLAHGPLVTSDMCAAFWLLASCGTAWRMTLHPTAQRVALFGIVTGLAFVSKFSAVLLLPVFALIAAATWLAQPRTRPWGGAGRLICLFAAGGLITWSVIWLFFGLRFAAFNPTAGPFNHFYLPWETIAREPQAWTKLIAMAQSIHFLPEAYLYGFSFVMFFSAERGAFLLGQFSSTGWWWFFPFAFLVKSTIGELLITACLATKGLRRITKIRYIDWKKALSSPLLPLLLFASVYGTFSLTTKLNIGQRHILPLYLVLFILAGILFSTRSPIFLRATALVALLAGAVESIANSPNNLAFFNRLAGGPANGWRLLVDSSLDWGQDVAPLGRWVQQNRRGSEPVYASCFGTADPQYEGIDGEMLAPYYSLGKPRHWFELQPGLYCVSATMLQDVYGIRPGLWTTEMEKDFQNLKIAARINLGNGSWKPAIPETGFHPEHPLWLLDRLRFARLCQYLKLKKPETVINYTQFVFRLSPEEIETFSDKPYSALRAMMEKAVAVQP